MLRNADGGLSDEAGADVEAELRSGEEAPGPLPLMPVRPMPGRLGAARRDEDTKDEPPKERRNAMVSLSLRAYTPSTTRQPR